LFRHEDWIQPGRIADYLDNRAIPWEMVALDRGESIPEDLDDVSALVFLGGTMSVNDGHAWLAREMRLIRAAAARDLPMLGHCLGSQLIAKALGATVAPMAAKEIGWHRMRRLDNPVAREWLGAVPERFELLTWHHEAFTLPPGATPLVASEHCLDHAYAIGNTVATVAHPEVTAGMLQEWLQIYGHDIEADGASVQPIGQIRERLPERCETMHRVFTDRLYDAWIGRVLAYG
jgi:GMP synthase-like glutamine amidotransferase